ncbi:uncharacterized protein LOC135819998 [Sycon ciliatum]|uniref:uncharacterized protein LOC135819998 n=1 Tax=Sycon ciliatum TaxID=27933 RepID=UPI0031F69171
MSSPNEQTTSEQEQPVESTGAAAAELPVTQAAQTSVDPRAVDGTADESHEAGNEDASKDQTDGTDAGAGDPERLLVSSNPEYKQMIQSRSNMKRRLTRVRQKIKIHLDLLGTDCFSADALGRLDVSAARSLYDEASGLKSNIEGIQDNIRRSLEDANEDKKLDEQDAWENNFELECVCLLRLAQCLQQCDHHSRTQYEAEDERRTRLRLLEEHGPRALDVLDATMSSPRSGPKPTCHASPTLHAWSEKSADTDIDTAASSACDTVEPPRQSQCESAEQSHAQSAVLHDIVHVVDATESPASAANAQETSAAVSVRSQPRSPVPPVPKPRVRHAIGPGTGRTAATPAVHAVPSPSPTYGSGEEDRAYDYEHYLQQETQDRQAVQQLQPDAETFYPPDHSVAARTAPPPATTWPRDAIAPLEQALQGAVMNVAQALSQNQTPQHTSISAAAGPSSVVFKLKPMEIPSFDGQVTNWPDFWDLFETAVDKQPMSDVVKLSYLKSALTGRAAHTLAGLAITNNNYATAVQLLKERYGRTDNIVAALYTKLQRLQSTSSKHRDIRNTIDNIERILRQLSAMGISVEQQPLLVQHILSKFPTEVLTKLEEWRTSSHQSWTVATLRSALQRYAEIHRNLREGSETSASQSSRTPATQTQHGSPMTMQGTGHALSSQSTHSAPPRLCVFCKGTHFNDQCVTYKLARTRQQKLREQGRCFICLRRSHMASQCPEKTKACFHCSKTGHNRAICPAHERREPSKGSSRPQPNGSQPARAVSTQGNDEELVNTCSASLVSEGPSDKTGAVFLQTAQVQIQAADGSFITAHALLDTGSNRTYMSTQLSKQLQLQPERQESLTLITFGVTHPRSVVTSVVQTSISLSDGQRYPIKANVLDTITRPIRRYPLPSEDAEFLAGEPSIQMADTIPSIAETRAIDILIGSDHYGNLVQGSPQRLPSGLYVMDTLLGHIVTGQCSSKSDDSNSSTLLVMTQASTGLQRPLYDYMATADSALLAEVEPNLTEFWSLERIGVEDPASLPTDDDTVRQFEETVTFADGRYTVQFPWKPDMQLPHNKDLAYGRMKSLGKRLAADRDLLTRYNDVLLQQERLGIIEQVTEKTKCGQRSHHLPHHPVLSPSKATTKLRVVYDASAKVNKTAPSLNDCLNQGPSLLPSLCGILLRFRLAPIVLISDIEKAFLQVRIQETDRDVTRFLWYRDITKPDVIVDNIEVYRFCRLPFGIISSPFLLDATIRHHLDKHKTATAAEIRKNIYVDNIMLTAGTAEEAEVKYRETRQVFNSASMNVREWSSNDPATSSVFDPSVTATNTSQKVLGLQWDTVADTFHIPGVSSESPDVDSIASKRRVLHNVARIYDPLGLFNPVTFHAKVFLRTLWRDDLSWDDALPTERLEQWQSIEGILEPVADIRIQRRTSTLKSVTDRQLHVFCDASKDSYAACVYLREANGPDATSTLLFCKMRLAPALH